jgi:hypothetical protein
MVLGEYLRQLLGALKFPALALLAIAALAYFSISKSPADLAIAETDELLLKLTALGRKGAVVLCNPESIEEHLSVRIDKGHLNEAGVGNSPVAVNTSNQSVFGSYSKLQSGAGTICRLQLQVVGRRFCDTDSARAQRLIGRRVQTRLAVPGEAGFYDHGYELMRDARERSVIGWREPGRSCPADVEIVAAVR